MKFALLVILVACGGSPRHAAPVVKADSDPDGPHRDAVAEQIQPLVDHEIVSGVVVGLYDHGKLEIYGFGRGPGGAPPNGHTLFELGGATRVYTGLLFADAIQRKEVELDAPLATLLPPGVTAPTKDGAAITLRHLALHASGLPRQPPGLLARAKQPDPYATYNEDALYADLVQTPLAMAPGTEIVESTFGSGVLGFVLGKKLGGGYEHAIGDRVLAPLQLHDTFITVPPAAAPRLATGTDSDLKPAPAWHWGALAGAGGLVSTARDQLALLAAELTASGDVHAPLAGALRFSQEPQLDGQGQNESLSWHIDAEGRYRYAGSSAGFRCQLGFDLKSRRGVVILAATNDVIVDRLFDVMMKVLAGTPPPPPELPAPAALAAFAGMYDLAGSRIPVTLVGKRLYLDDNGVRRRLVPYSERGFWVEELQAMVLFDQDAMRFMLPRGEVSAKRVAP